MIRESKGAAVASLILCSILWSTAGFLVKLVSWDPFAIAGIRSLIGFLTMLIVIRKPRFTFSRDQVMAALMYSATMILFITANKTTTSANAVLLQYTEPIFIVILGRWLLGDEKATVGDWLAVAGVFGGMILFFLDDLSLSGNFGNILAVLSGVTFALTAIFMRRQKDGRPTDSFMLAHIITFAVSIPFIFTSPAPTVTSMTGLVLLGIFQMGLPSLLYGKGVRGVSAISCALITMIEPIMNPVWVAIFIGELPSARAIAGGCIIVVCVTLRTVLKVRKMR
ncbi:MAG TPA: DMT family transporter [Treponemataceae bacterium]|nr:DMT family transporter [Treponemataceae bacterium]HPS44398.1 DMT family transporter [Treponemataceae bacterium]